METLFRKRLIPNHFLRQHSLISVQKTNRPRLQPRAAYIEQLTPKRICRPSICIIPLWDRLCKVCPKGVLFWHEKICINGQTDYSRRKLPSMVNVSAFEGIQSEKFSRRLHCFNKKKKAAQPLNPLPVNGGKIILLKSSMAAAMFTLQLSAVRSNTSLLILSKTSKQRI